MEWCTVWGGAAVVESRSGLGGAGKIRVCMASSRSFVPNVEVVEFERIASTPSKIELRVAKGQFVC